MYKAKSRHGHLCVRPNMVTPLTPQVLSLLFPGTTSAVKQSNIPPVNAFRFLKISLERLREEAQHEQPNLRKALGHASIVDGVSKLLCIDRLPLVKKRPELDQKRCHPCAVGRNESCNHHLAIDTLPQFGDHYEDGPISEEWLEDRSIKLIADEQTGSPAGIGKFKRISDHNDSYTCDCSYDDFPSFESSDDELGTSGALESSDDSDSSSSPLSGCSDDADESKSVRRLRTIRLTEYDTGFTEICDQNIETVVELNHRNIACPPKCANDDA